MPKTARRYASLGERLAASTVIDPFTGCYEWEGFRNAAGYGKISMRVPGKRTPASVWVHRLSWELRHGKTIPAGMEVDHTCRNPSCIRPDHLEVVTPSVNLSRRVFRSQYRDGASTAA